eukprot:s4455_g2.t1
MEVCFLASGEKVALLETAEFEGKSAKAVKQTLAAKIGVTRFRQRFFLEGDAVEIPDDEVFASVPVKVQLVVLEFCPPDAEEDERMMTAAREDDTIGLEQLLKCPRSPNTRDAEGMTPLYHAAECGHVEPMRLLVESGAEIDALSTGLRMAPLHMAAVHAHLEAVCFLVENGAQKDLRDARRATPLKLAVHYGHVDIARFLVEKGALQDELLTGKALISTAKYGSLDMIRFQVELGCDKDATNQDGTTPLIAAAHRGILRIVRFLVESGACPHAVDIDGKTALDQASERGHAEVVRYLSKFK